MAAAASVASPPAWHGRRSAALGFALALLVLAAAPHAARAALRYDPDSDAEGGSLMTPTRGELLSRRFYYEIPHDPVGVLFMGKSAPEIKQLDATPIDLQHCSVACLETSPAACCACRLLSCCCILSYPVPTACSHPACTNAAHGCVHDAADFWPPSKACPECSGAGQVAGVLELSEHSTSMRSSPSRFIVGGAFLQPRVAPCTTLKHGSGSLCCDSQPAGACSTAAVVVASRSVQ